MIEKKLIFVGYLPDKNSGGNSIIPSMIKHINKLYKCPIVYFFMLDIGREKPITSEMQMYNEMKAYEEEHLPIATMEIVNDKNNIVIYPENCMNPLTFQQIVRFNFYFNVLNPSSDNEFNIFFFEAYDKLYNHVRKLCNVKQIENYKNFHKYINYYHNLNEVLDVCKDYGEERQGSCYIVRKGIMHPHIRNNLNYHPVDSYLILYEETNIYNSVKIFNKYKYFYSYDGFTLLSCIASLCGCISIIVPFSNFNSISEFSCEDYFKNGIAYGNSPEEIEYAIKTRDKLRESLILIRDINFDELFIELIESIYENFGSKIEKCLLK
jgi:hypothetical protein